MDRFVSSVIVLISLWAAPAIAQTPETPFDAAVQFVWSNSGEFDADDYGVGGRVGWRPVDLVGVEAELDFYPREFPDTVPFSRSRVEGLFGVTVGPTIGRIRPFAKLRPGFFTFREAPQPFACILIFPPPLVCAVAVGQTAFAMDIGGGIEVTASRRAFVRVDAGDRLIKYPGPVFRSNHPEQDGFISHDFRFAAGVGLGF
jgi:hypothetical protein